MDGVDHNIPEICDHDIFHNCHSYLDKADQDKTDSVDITYTAKRQNKSYDETSSQERQNMNQQKEEKQKGGRGISLLKYIADELKRNYMLEYNEKKLRERRKRVYTFVKTPRELEKFLIFGFLLVLDVFLFIFTFLPLRLLIAAFSALFRLCTAPSRSLLEPIQKIDFLKGIILITVSIIVQNIDTSVIYHVVRVQSVIKLYVVYNMLDIADKLLASLGQDVLDALYWTGTEPRGRRREHCGVIPHLLLSLVYVFIHTILNLSQAIVLNVAINSFNKSLLTIMISNQFIEIKSSVFKRFEKNNLFQMSCSDVRERFHYFILILIVAIRNLTEHGWKFEYALGTLAPFAVVVIASELIVDWFKHGFITKFNNIQPEIYLTYRSFLAKDILYSKQDSGFTGHTDQVSRRMGFTALPYAVLLIKIFKQCISLSGWAGLCFAFLGYLCLCAFKLLVSIHIFGKAAQYVKEDNKAKKVQTTLYNPSWSFEIADSIQEMNDSSEMGSQISSKSSLSGVN